VRREPVGRWKTDDGVHYFDFLADDMAELGYAGNGDELPS
jgi:hypothetical protein